MKTGVARDWGHRDKNEKTSQSFFKPGFADTLAKIPRLSRVALPFTKPLTSVV
jgi:hypothetical protein